MAGFWRENSGPVVVSVLLHAVLAAGLVLVSLLHNQSPAPSLQPIPIDAMVVDSRVLHAAEQVKADRAAQAIAVAQAAAEAKAAAAAQAAAAQQASDARAAEDQSADARAAEEAQAAAAKQGAAEQARTEADANAANLAKAAEQQQKAADVRQRADAEKAAAAEASAAEAQRAALAKKALAKQAAEAKQAEDAKRADAKQAAEAQQAADAKRAADEQAKKDREAELRRQLAEEEHVSAVESGPLRDRYITLLRNKIQNAWIKPPSARAGVDCLVEVTQVPGGEVTAARVTQCNGDAAVRQSIENAVYRSSPLPDPPDPALFERNFVFRFKPNE